jgi:uncharacterized protein YjaZ
MHFNILDTETTYRRLLDTADAETRNAIYRQEIIEPFRGIVDIFGGSGGDGLAQFAMWGMSPDQLAGDKREASAATIDALAKADAWKRAANSLAKGYAAFADYGDRIALDSITFGLLIADMSNSPYGMNYTGFGGIPGWIMTVYGAASEYNLARVEACTVHELHHNLGGASGAVFGGKGDMNSVTVGEYMIGEGLAESFAAELYGADKTGLWVNDFDESRLEETKTIFRAGLNRAGFDVVRGYIYGGQIAESMGFEGVDVPALAGYALGYRVVQAYLERTGKNVVQTTFTPVAEVIEESGFFG